MLDFARAHVLRSKDVPILYFSDKLFFSQICARMIKYHTLKYVRMTQIISYTYDAYLQTLFRPL